MDTKKAYDQWSATYDINANKTRDLEALAIRDTLSGRSFESVLEIGCGTGKNTSWLLDVSQQVTGVDLSEQMLEVAKRKITSDRVRFIHADILQPWDFADQEFDLISFSLVLEHIADLPAIFEKAASRLKEGGLVYIGELHPFKQYEGSKARFDTVDGTKILMCYTHHISDFVKAAGARDLRLIDLKEYFDPNGEIPRILTLLFEKTEK